MDYELKIRDVNIPAHLDVEKEIAARKEGQLTFTVRINDGNIVDLSTVEYVNANQYLRLKSVIRTEFVVQHPIK